MDYLVTMAKAFDTVRDCIQKSIDLTEVDLDYSFSDDEKEVCIGFALLYLFTKYGK